MEEIRDGASTLASSFGIPDGVRRAYETDNYYFFECDNIRYRVPKDVNSIDGFVVHFHGAGGNDASTLLESMEEMGVENSIVIFPSDSNSTYGWNYDHMYRSFENIETDINSIASTLGIDNTMPSITSHSSGGAPGIYAYGYFLSKHGDAQGAVYVAVDPKNENGFRLLYNDGGADQYYNNPEVLRQIAEAHGTIIVLRYEESGSGSFSGGGLGAGSHSWRDIYATLAQEGANVVSIMVNPSGWGNDRAHGEILQWAARQGLYKFLGHEIETFGDERITGITLYNRKTGKWDEISLDQLAELVCADNVYIRSIVSLSSGLDTLKSINPSTISFDSTSKLLPKENDVLKKIKKACDTLSTAMSDEILQILKAGDDYQKLESQLAESTSELIRKFNEDSITKDMMITERLKNYDSQQSEEINGDIDKLYSTYVDSKPKEETSDKEDKKESEPGFFSRLFGASDNQAREPISSMAIGAAGLASIHETVEQSKENNSSVESSETGGKIIDIGNRGVQALNGFEGHSFKNEKTSTEDSTKELIQSEEKTEQTSPSDTIVEEKNTTQDERMSDRKEIQLEDDEMLVYDAWDKEHKYPYKVKKPSVTSPTSQDTVESTEDSSQQPEIHSQQPSYSSPSPSSQPEPTPATQEIENQEEPQNINPVSNEQVHENEEIKIPDEVVEIESPVVEDMVEESNVIENVTPTVPSKPNTTKPSNKPSSQITKPEVTQDIPSIIEITEEEKIVSPEEIIEPIIEPPIIEEPSFEELIEPTIEEPIKENKSGDNLAKTVAIAAGVGAALGAGAYITNEVVKNKTPKDSYKYEYEYSSSEDKEDEFTEYESDEDKETISDYYEGDK